MEKRGKKKMKEKNERREQTMCLESKNGNEGGFSPKRKDAGEEQDGFTTEKHHHVSYLFTSCFRLIWTRKKL